MTEQFESMCLKRLEKLPKKVNLCFRDLLKLKHIEPNTLWTLLDASDCIADSNTLIGFASTYYHMEKCNVPMKDIITMAKDQKRSLNPRWSRTHWIAAHNRFSRAATLSKLADENITYDLAVYRDKLPDRWPGYLVPTSRKFGSEGLRQEHCVAAYHNRILNKSCAIACVFIDKVRWTVELSVFEGTIRIHQIRAKHNRAASPEIRSAIYRLLEIEEPKTRLLTSILPNSSESRKNELMLLNLQRIVPILREKGVDMV